MQILSHTATRNQEKPIVSFIVTLYNVQEDALRKCIESILALNLKESEREIILIDDGSDSSLLEDVLLLTDKIIYLYQPRKGFSAARNVGINIAKGDFIQFIDGNDYLLSKAYDQCVDIMRYRGADFVLFNFTSEQKEFISFRAQGPFTGAEYMAANNIKTKVWSFSFKKELLGNLHFAENTTHEDEEFTPLLMLQSKHFFSTKGVAYHRHKSTAEPEKSQQDTRTRVRFLADLEHVLFRLADKRHLYSGTKRSAIDRRIAQLTMDYLYNVITQTKSEAHLKRAIARLEERGLYPLPKNAYTWRYRMFSKLINKSPFRKTILLAMILFKH